MTQIKLLREIETEMKPNDFDCFDSNTQIALSWMQIYRNMHAFVTRKSDFDFYLTKCVLIFAASDQRQRQWSKIVVFFSFSSYYFFFWLYSVKWCNRLNRISYEISQANALSRSNRIELLAEFCFFGDERDLIFNLLAFIFSLGERQLHLSWGHCSYFAIRRWSKYHFTHFNANEHTNCQMIFAIAMRKSRLSLKRINTSNNGSFYLIIMTIHRFCI